MTGKPTTHLISVELSFVLPDGEINGTLRLDGADRQAWYAQPTRHTDFAHAQDIAAQRPWAAADATGDGYEFHLPAGLDNAAPVLRQRIALALEEFIYARRSGQLTGPYHRQLTTAVTAEHPTWELNVPRVAG